jgi:hypothetical protein
MFAGVIAWEGMAAALFWRAWWKFRDRSSGQNWFFPAFTTSLMLWAAFLLVDEVFITYAYAGTPSAVRGPPGDPSRHRTRT